MSGHSKWHTIKHKKGAADAKRGKVFTRIIKELTVAARNGGGDPDANPRLRTVVAEAKSVNMPAENIKRAIQRGTGELPGVSYEEITYEGYGPGGAALIIEVLTDNRNRTVGELRHLLTKHSGNLGETGSVAWMFSKKGYIVVEKSAADEERLLAAVLDAGGETGSVAWMFSKKGYIVVEKSVADEEHLLAAVLDAGGEDLRDDGDTWEIISDPAAFEPVRDAVKALGIEPASAEVAMLPQNYVKLEGKAATQMVKLMEVLDEHDDVKHVWSNFDIEEKEIEASLA